jgi:hypothetical protein
MVESYLSAFTFELGDWEGAAIAEFHRELALITDEVVNDEITVSA